MSHRKKKKLNPKPIVRRSLVMEILTQSSDDNDTCPLLKSIAQTAPQPSIGLQKKTAYRNKKNLERIRAFGCFICGQKPCDADHIKSRGSGGGDEMTNLNALCRSHHIEKHSIGTKRFFDRYYTIISQMREKYELPEMYLDFLD